MKNGRPVGRSAGPLLFARRPPHRPSTLFFSLSPPACRGTTRATLHPAHRPASTRVRQRRTACPGAPPPRAPAPPHAHALPLRRALPSFFSIPAPPRPSSVLPAPHDAPHVVRHRRCRPRAAGRSLLPGPEMLRQLAAHDGGWGERGEGERHKAHARLARGAPRSTTPPALPHPFHVRTHSRPASSSSPSCVPS